MLSIGYIVIRLKSNVKYLFLFLNVTIIFLASPFINKTLLSYKDINRVIDKFTGIVTIRVEDGQVYAEDGSAAQRLELIRVAKHYFLQHPFFGIGRGSFFPLAGKVSHNNYIQMFAETGLVGGVLFMLLTVTVFAYLIGGLKDSQNKAFWFFLMNSFLVTVIIFAVESYIQLKLFWVFIVPFAVVARSKSIKKYRRAKIQ
jgi:O-antigen ligase